MSQYDYDDHQAEFRERFEWLRQCGLKETTAVDPDAYWLVVGNQPMEAIRQAILAAPRAFQTFFPAAGVLLTLVQKHARELQRPTQTTLLPERPTNVEPVTLAPNNPFLLLAQEWEEESRRSRLDPEKATPREIAFGRMAQLDELLGRTSIAEFPRESPKRRRVAR